jgi:hypothetical protein
MHGYIPPLLHMPSRGGALLNTGTHLVLQIHCLFDYVSTSPSMTRPPVGDVLYVGESKIIRTIGTCSTVGYTVGWT